MADERYSPTLNKPHTSYAHWHRYLLATNLTRGKTILDIACGEGYGSYLLAEHSSGVIGVDIDESTMIHASKKYHRRNLNFVVGSAASVPLKSGGFDVIICFETIEHLTDREQKSFLLDVKRLLKRGGILIVSTPDKLEYSDKIGFKSEFHQKEFTLKEFRNFLRKYFKNVTFLGQRIYPASSIWNMNEPAGTCFEYALKYSEVGGFSPTDMSARRPLYLIAMCCNQKIRGASSSVCIDVSNRMVLDLLNRLKNKEEIIQGLLASPTWKIGKIVTAPLRWGRNITKKFLSVFSW
jgi:ubiquinone/menaquinone biosynthesis C-methylase UbiE